MASPWVSDITSRTIAAAALALCLGAPTALAQPANQGQCVYTTPSNNICNIPAGATNITMEVIGGGASGGNATGTGGPLRGGDGGGGAKITISNVNLTLPVNLGVAVGAGGIYSDTDVNISRGGQGGQRSAISIVATGALLVVAGGGGGGAGGYTTTQSGTVVGGRGGDAGANANGSGSDGLTTDGLPDVPGRGGANSTGGAGGAGANGGRAGTGSAGGAGGSNAFAARSGGGSGGNGYGGGGGGGAGHEGNSVYRVGAGGGGGGSLVPSGGTITTANNGGLGRDSQSSGANATRPTNGGSGSVRITWTVAPTLASQTITNFIANPAAISVGGSSTLSATKGAGSAPLLFSSKTMPVCTVTGSTVTAVAPGTCTVAANQAADGTYSAAPEVLATITVSKANQTITGFSANPTIIAIGGTSTLSATKGSGSAELLFSSKTMSVCTVLGNTVTGVASGTCTVAANQPEDSNTNAAPEVTTNITVGKTSQTITGFSANPTSIVVGGTSALSATKGAGSAAVAFSSKTTGICTVAGNTVTAVAAGTCTVAANQAADETYAAAPELTTNITVGKAAQTITAFSANPTSIAIGGTSTLSATKGAGSAAVTFSSKTAAVCTVTGSTVTAVTAGTCTVAANQAADDNYNAAPEVTLNLTIGKGTQAITGFAANPASISVGGTSTLSATKGAGSATLEFSSKTAGICTVAGNTVTAVTAGTCTVAANQAADDNYNAAPEVTLNLTIGKGTQAITGFAANPAGMAVGGTSTLSATKGAGSAAVAFSSKTAAVCTVTGNTVTAVTAGTCTVAANQAADDNYNAAPEVTLNLTIGKGTQAITGFAANPPGMAVGGTSTLSATKGAGSAAVAFSSKTAAICTVAGNTVTAVTAGTCTVAANQPEDDNYSAAPEVTLNLTIGRGTQAITGLAANPAAISVGGTSTLSATKGAGSAAVAFSSKTAAVCTVTGSTVTAVTAGTCTVAANQAADDNYAAAPEVTLNLTIGKGTQAITGFAANPPGIAVGGTSTLSATKGAGSAAVTFSSKTTGICTVAGNTVTAVTAGTCTVAANQAADDNYNAAPEVTLNLTIGKGTQAITGFASNPTSLIVGGTGTLSATKGAGSAAVAFSSKTAAVCTVAGTTVTAVTAGTCTVAANQAADDNFAAAPEVTLNLTVDKAGQTITRFASDPARIAVGGKSTLSATKGAGTAAVEFGSASAEVCTVDGANVTAIAAGTCRVVARQAGDANYLAAPDVNLEIPVDKAAQTIRNLSISAATLHVGQTATLSATPGPGSAAVVFSSKTAAVCTVAGRTLTAVAEGTCTVAANQAGDANYLVAEEVTTGLRITPAPVKGECGAAQTRPSLIKPSAGLCSAGTPSAVSIQSRWQWTCTGSNGGANASCSAPLGQAGSTQLRIDGPTGNSGPQAWRIVDAEVTMTPPVAPPAGLRFPFGVVAMLLDSGTPGTSTTVTLIYGQDIPAGARYWKYGRRAAGEPERWYIYPHAVISGNTVTLTLTDGAMGDADLSPNGRILDPGGPGVGGTTAQVPTLSEWGLILMAGLLMLAMANHARHRQRRRRA